MWIDKSGKEIKMNKYILSAFAIVDLLLGIGYVYLLASGRATSSALAVSAVICNFAAGFCAAVAMRLWDRGW